MRRPVIAQIARSAACGALMFRVAVASADEPGIAGKLRKLFRASKATATESTQVSPKRQLATPLPDPAVPTSHFRSTDTIQLAAALPSPESESDSVTQQELTRFETLAVGSHPALRQAQSAIRAAAGRQIQASLYPNPTVGYAGSELGNEGRAGQQGIVFGQELVRGGKIQWAVQVADSERERAETQAAIQLWRVRNTVRNLYYELLAGQEMARLTQELVALAEKGVSVAQQREKAGEGTLAEILQAQIELDEVRILASNSTNRQRANWQRFAAAIGSPKLAPEPLQGIIEPDATERDAEATLAAIQLQSPEARLAATGIRRAEAAVARARAESVPNLTLEAGTQYDFATNSQIANVGLSWPIPVHNKNQGNIIAAEAELHSAREEVDRVALMIASRFADAYARYRTARDQVERYGKRLPEPEIKAILALSGAARQDALDARAQILPRSQLALALATEGWQRGEFNYLQVLTAQRTLTQATLNYVRALASLRQSISAMDGYLLTEPDDRDRVVITPERD